jgi:hypothetical protein
VNPMRWLVSGNRDLYRAFRVWWMDDHAVTKRLLELERFADRAEARIQEERANAINYRAQAQRYSAFLDHLSSQSPGTDYRERYYAWVIETSRAQREKRGKKTTEPS